MKMTSDSSLMPKFYSVDGGIRKEGSKDVLFIDSSVYVGFCQTDAGWWCVKQEWVEQVRSLIEMDSEFKHIRNCIDVVWISGQDKTKHVKTTLDAAVKSYMEEKKNMLIRLAKEIDNSKRLLSITEGLTEDEMSKLRMCGHVERSVDSSWSPSF